MRLQIVGLTDVGRVRAGNEDSILVAPEFSLAVVCDGMGGHEAGEVASQTAVDSIQAWYAQGGDEGAHFQLDPSLPAPARRIASAVLYADHVKQLRRMPGVWPPEFEGSASAASRSKPSCDSSAAAAISAAPTVERLVSTTSGNLVTGLPAAW